MVVPKIILYLILTILRMVEASFCYKAADRLPACRTDSICHPNHTTTAVETEVPGGNKGPDVISQSIIGDKILHVVVIGLNVAVISNSSDCAWSIGVIHGVSLVALSRFPELKVKISVGWNVLKFGKF